MSKGRAPRKRKDSKPDLNPVDEQEASSLVPSPRPPLPVPARARESRPVLYDLLQTLRSAVGTMLDIADGVAEVITKRLEGRPE